MMPAVTLALVSVLLAFASDSMREIKGYATAVAFAVLSVAALVIATRLAVGVMLP